jgi:hypothetical protein
LPYRSVLELQASPARACGSWGFLAVPEMAERVWSGGDWSSDSNRDPTVSGDRSDFRWLRRSSRVSTEPGAPGGDRPAVVKMRRFGGCRQSWPGRTLAGAISRKAAPGSHRTGAMGAVTARVGGPADGNVYYPISIQRSRIARPHKRHRIRNPFAHLALIPSCDQQR